MPCCRCALVGQDGQVQEGWRSGAWQGGRLAGLCVALWGWVGASQREAQPVSASQAILKRGLKSSCTVIPLMKKDHRDNLEFFLGNVGRLHLMGCVPSPCLTPGSPSATGWP